MYGNVTVKTPYATNICKSNVKNNEKRKKLIDLDSATFHVKMSFTTNLFLFRALLLTCFYYCNSYEEMQILSLETCAQQGYESESKTIPFV
jgi:hypothetical protein